MLNNFQINFVQNFQISHINSNNQHSYSPYTFDFDKNYYVVCATWYNTLTEPVRQELKTKFNVGEIIDMNFPHQVQKVYEYWEIYTWYNCQLYDYSRYIHDINAINNEQNYLVSFQDNKQRTEFSQLFFKQHPKIQNMERLNIQLQKILQKNKQKGYFVKLTQRSGKNEIKLFPAKTVEDVYKNLIYSNDVKKQIYQSAGILLKQWQVFENSVQFRALVYNRRLLGISPQYYQRKLEWKTINFEKLFGLTKQKISQVKFANSFVLDLMFVNNSEVRFLQFNPYGVYSASRSALFTHQDILKLQRQQQPPVLKILDKQI